MNTANTTTNNLLFLLAAAPLGMGCIIVTDDGDDTTGADTGNQETGNQTTSATSTGTDTTPPATDEGTDTGSGSSTAADTTEGLDTSDGADTTTGVLPSVCEEYAAHAIKCAIPYAEYFADSCYYNLDYQEYTSAACGSAFLDYVACLSTLPCKELMGAAPCDAELQQLIELGCPTVEF